MTYTQTGFDVVTIYWRKLQISDNWQNICTDLQGRITVLYNQALAWDYVRSWLMLPDLPAAVINFELESESVSYLLFLNHDFKFSVTWTMQSEPVSSKSLPPKTSTEQLNKKLDNSWYLGIHYLAAMSPWPNLLSWNKLDLFATERTAHAMRGYNTGSFRHIETTFLNQPESF